MLGEHFDQLFVVLLGGIEIGVDEGAAVVVAEIFDDLRIFAEPGFLAAELLVAGDALVAAGGIEGGLEVVGKAEDDVDGARLTRSQRVQRDGGQHSAAVGEFFVEETHLLSVVFR